MSSLLRSVSKPLPFLPGDCSLLSLVKGRRHYLRPAPLGTDLDVDGTADGRKRRRHVSERDVFRERRRRRAACHHSNVVTLLVQATIAVARNSALHHFEAYQRPLQSRGTRFGQCGTSDKLALFDFAIAVEASLPNIDFVADLVLVQRHFGLEPEGIPRSETARHDTQFLPGVDNLLPDSLAGADVGGDINLESVFAGVARSGDERIAQPAHRSMCKPVVPDAVKRRVGQFSQYIDSARALNRQLGVCVTTIFYLAVEIPCIFSHPGDVFLARACVDHQEIVLFPETVDDDIVYERPFRIKHRRVLRLADRQFGGVVHGDVLHGRESCTRGLPAVNANVTHVTHVKNADSVAYRLVFGYQAAAQGVFHGHVPAAKIHHLCPKAAMQRVQGRLSGFAAPTKSWHANREIPVGSSPVASFRLLLVAQPSGRVCSEALMAAHPQIVCTQCDKPEDSCTCEKYCTICKGQHNVRLCADGLYYCPDCREACDVALANER